MAGKILFVTTTLWAFSILAYLHIWFACAVIGGFYVLWGIFWWAG